MSETIYKDIVAFHPGSYVNDIIQELNVTQVDFAKRLDSNVKTVSGLVNGTVNITLDLANKLSKLTGTSIDLWLNLQKEYEKKIIEIENQKIADEEEVCKIIEISYFKKNGLLPAHRMSIKEKIQALRSILKYANLTKLQEFNTVVSWRRQDNFKLINVVNANVMLEIAINLARDKTDNKLDIKKLNSYLPEIKEMTKSEDSSFFSRLKELLLDCGIVLIALPHLKNAGINGATTKFNNGSVLLMITDRNKSSDIFWFSLYHELGHILNKDFISNLSEDEYTERETKADLFAQNELIPKDSYTGFIEDRIFTSESIKDFANSNGIHPGIVVGRLQRDEYIPWNSLNDVKVSYQIELSTIGK